MIDFHPPRLEEKPWVDELLRRADYRGCDYNFTNLFVWSRAYHQEIARVDDFLVTHVCGRMGCSFMFPAGGGDLASVIRKLEEEAAGRGRAPCGWCALPRAKWRSWRSFFPVSLPSPPTGTDTTISTRSTAWPIWAASACMPSATISIRFMENNPSWTYEEITPESLGECLAMDKEWYRRSLAREGEAEERDLGDEGVALRQAMEHYQALGLEGGLIRVYGELVTFTMGIC